MGSEIPLKGEWKVLRFSFGSTILYLAATKRDRLELVAKGDGIPRAVFSRAEWKRVFSMLKELEDLEERRAWVRNLVDVKLQFPESLVESAGLSETLSNADGRRFALDQVVNLENVRTSDDTEIDGKESRPSPRSEDQSRLL